jgi:hypothetical protein
VGLGVSSAITSVAELPAMGLYSAPTSTASTVGRIALTLALLLQQQGSGRKAVR